jgi:raffinose/stachyose/melibiose transport system substrate-binding protein
MRISPVLAAVAAVALLAAGCSDNTANGGGGGSGAPASWPAPTGRLDGVTLTMWTAQNSAQTPKSVIAAFHAATGATINTVTVPDPYETGIETKVATGDKPDLAFWQPTASQLTVLRPEANLQVLDGAPWLGSMDPSVRDITGLLGGKRYAALVTSPAVEGVYYNKQVFARAGVTATPKNFDDMVTLARSLKNKGITPFYEAAGDRWPTQWWVQVQLADAARAGFWDKVNKNQEGFTSPVVLDAIKKYKSLVDEGLFNSDLKTATFVDQGDALLAGKAAMVLQVNSYLNQLQEKTGSAAELDSKIGFFPISPSGNDGTSIPDQSNAVVAFRTGDATREAAARQFLAYWMGPGYKDFVAARGTVSLETAVPTPDTVPRVAVVVHKSLATSVGSFQSLAIANPDLYLNLTDMLYGRKTPEQVAKATQQQFAQLAKAQGAPGF